MAVTRHRFISSVGDNTKEHYQQNYLLTAPLTIDSDVVLNPPDSWVGLCARSGMCDAHLDALSCLQSAISRGFNTLRGIKARCICTFLFIPHAVFNILTDKKVHST